MNSLGVAQNVYVFKCRENRFEPIEEENARKMCREKRLGQTQAQTQHTYDDAHSII